MRKKLAYLCFSIVFFSLLNACQWFNRDGDEDALARVGDYYLYKKDAMEAINFSNNSDSSQLIETYVDNWVRDQLLIQKALQNLPESDIDFNKQLESYRNSLIVYAYENQLVFQKLDTLVDARIVEKYYENNSANFELREPIFQGRYIQFIAAAPNQDSLDIWMKGHLLEDNEKLEGYCTQFSTRFQLDTVAWTSFSTLAKFLLEKNTKELLREMKLGYNTIKDSTTLLKMDVREIMKTGEIAPIDYVAPKIKSIIRNKRKIELIAKAKEEIFEEATLKKSYEVY